MGYRLDRAGDGQSTPSHQKRSRVSNQIAKPVRTYNSISRHNELSTTVVLADRRKRRRANKTAVNPKQQDSESDSEQAAMDHIKSRKKDRKTSLASGLALMHGFSAENLGRGRLTVSRGL